MKIKVSSTCILNADHITGVLIKEDEYVFSMLNAGKFVVNRTEENVIDAGELERILLITS